MVRAVDGVSFSVDAGEVVGIVGESGSGKSVTALSLLRLLPKTARIAGGRIRFDGQDLLALSERAMRRVRGNTMAMIFQDPMTSLNPTIPIGHQIAESYYLHRGGNWTRGAGPGGGVARRGRRAAMPAPGCATTRTSSPVACASG